VASREASWLTELSRRTDLHGVFRLPGPSASCGSLRMHRSSRP
jgi:hypothetical protein